MNAITFNHIHKTFKDYRGKKLEALHDVTCSIKQGEFFILLGPSGCGKSTLLRIASGLEKDFAGECVYDKEINQSAFGFVFQSFAILPWLSVYDNVALPLVAQKMNENKIHTLVMEELESLGLTKFAHHLPKELSGGMKQRVGIARALVIKPKVIFLDEPFSALDSFTATELRIELLKIWQERKMTIVMVTHNIEEAIELGDRIAVMSARPGKIDTIIDNTFSRPRNSRSQTFFEMEDKITELIVKG
ncbi:MAG: ABC transporter ATP-binding protein [bacterium]